MVRFLLFGLLLILISCREEEKGVGEVIRLKAEGLSLDLAAAACGLGDDGVVTLEELKERCLDSMIVERVEVSKGSDGVLNLHVWGGRWGYYAVLDDGVFVVSEHGKVLGEVGGRLWNALPMVWFRYVKSTDWAWKAELAPKTGHFLEQISKILGYPYRSIDYKPYQGYAVYFETPRLEVVFGERDLERRLRELPALIARANLEGGIPKRVMFMDKEGHDVSAVVTLKEVR